MKKKLFQCLYQHTNGNKYNCYVVAEDAGNVVTILKTTNHQFRELKSLTEVEDGKLFLL